MNRAAPEGHGIPGPWPRWTTRLTPAPGSKVVEGGRRLAGEAESVGLDRVLVSYVTVVRNNAATLSRTIESVRIQTHPDVEHVILDGASTDGTLDVLLAYGEQVDYFASDTDDGIYDALNKAIPLTRGNLICVLNSDDWLEPNAAARAVSLVGAAPGPTLLLTGATARQSSREDHEPPVALEWYPAIVHAGSYFTCADDCHNGIYATRGAYELSGPYDPSYEIAADFKWLMSCFEAGIDLVYTRDITVNYMLGGASGDAEKHARECLRVMRERFPSLTPEEAGGLYHSFFDFPTFPSIPGRPDDPLDFLRDVLAGHSEDHDLLTSVAWALLAHAQRRRDGDGTRAAETAPAARASIKDVVKLALASHPRMDRIARRLYAGMHRA